MALLHIVLVEFCFHSCSVVLETSVRIPVFLCSSFHILDLFFFLHSEILYSLARPGAVVTERRELTVAETRANWIIPVTGTSSGRVLLLPAT
jgi:hypothetical protein